MARQRQTALRKPAILYAAKSTKDERGSIPDQLKKCREMAEADGYEVVAEYEEENVSAYHGDRGRAKTPGGGKS